MPPDGGSAGGSCHSLHHSSYSHLSSRQHDVTPPEHDTDRSSDPPRDAFRPSALAFVPIPSVLFPTRAHRRHRGGCVLIRALPTRRVRRGPGRESLPGGRYRPVPRGTPLPPRLYRIHLRRCHWMHCSFLMRIRTPQRELVIVWLSSPLLWCVVYRPLPFFVAAFRLRPWSLVWILARRVVWIRTLVGWHLGQIHRRRSHPTRTSCHLMRSYH
mmetsp:Transcript_41492/g.74792  ORF Transcript_41492/g.74792 Transcript_41492/m.74792 type:complete len:213 (-) Transcript_41492:1043-1681(-)